MTSSEEDNSDPQPVEVLKPKFFERISEFNLVHIAKETWQQKRCHGNLLTRSGTAIAESCVSLAWLPVGRLASVFPGISTRVEGVGCRILDAAEAVPELKSSLTVAVQSRVRKVIDTPRGRRVLDVVEDFIPVLEKIYKDMEKSLEPPPSDDEDEGVDIPDNPDQEKETKRRFSMRLYPIRALLASVKIFRHILLISAGIENSAELLDKGHPAASRQSADIGTLPSSQLERCQGFFWPQIFKFINDKNLNPFKENSIIKALKFFTNLRPCKHELQLTLDITEEVVRRGPEVTPAIIRGRQFIATVVAEIHFGRVPTPQRVLGRPVTGSLEVSQSPRLTSGASHTGHPEHLEFEDLNTSPSAGINTESLASADVHLRESPEIQADHHPLYSPTHDLEFVNGFREGSSNDSTPMPSSGESTGHRLHDSSTCDSHEGSMEGIPGCGIVASPESSPEMSPEVVQSDL